MVKILYLLPPTLLLSGCYYTQAAAGQWEVIRKREPIKELIASADTSPELAAKLMLVEEARDFSIDVLGLPDNKSYRTFTELERDYVVWNVFAAPEFSLQPKRWCFPVAGCVSYRGYFSKDRAIRKSNVLSKQGFDVAVGGVAAYSTLGKFNDPLLSTMLRWDDVDLAAVLFHELAHQIVYVKDDSAFNESFATAVEEFGVTRWLDSQGQGEQISSYHSGRELQQQLMSIVSVARVDLGAIYAADHQPERMREHKQTRLDRLRDELRAEMERSGRQSSSWLDSDLNNARLISMTLYEGRLPSFRAMIKNCKQDIQCFYAAAKALATKSREERDSYLDGLLAEP